MRIRREDALPADATSGDRMRLDKWLWAARFFKTRSLATHAIDNGRVKVGGARVKPAREIRPGDQLNIRNGEVEWAVTVLGLSAQRRGAPEAQAMYAESEDSRIRREAARAERRGDTQSAVPVKGRPTKRDRRQIHRFTES